MGDAAPSPDAEADRSVFLASLPPLALPAGLPEEDAVHVETHLRGPGVGPMAPELQAQVDCLRRAVRRQDPGGCARHAAWMTDQRLTCFLVARKFSRDAAASLLASTLAWRDVRNPTWVCDDPTAARSVAFERENATGKIRVPGVDRWGRAVLCFDNSCQNTNDRTGQMEFLAYSLALCGRTHRPGRDKLVVVMNLEKFSYVERGRCSCSCY